MQNKGIYDAIFCKIRKFVWLFQKKILPLQQIYFTMNEKIILQVLAEQQEYKERYKKNTWISRKEEDLFELGSNMAQVVIGVRRSGKSTLCHKVLIEQQIRYAYVDFDDDRLYGMQSADLNTVLNCVYQLYGTDIEYIFLDEVQDVTGWHLFVNRLLRQGIHVFLTGSNAKLLSSELATHLTGRYNEIRLFPFSYLEFCQAENVSLDGITTQADAARKSALTRYLNDGGMPELHYIKRPQNRRTYIDGLIETIVAKDIVGRFKIHNTEGLRRIAHHLINNSCQIINYDSLLDIASLSAGKTAQKYVSYLSQAFLIHKLQQFSFKSRQRITNEKAYVIDTGFIANRDNALLGENIGWRLENVVLIELLRRYHSAADDIYYYKPSARQKEIDFVVCRQGVVIELIQVAYTIADSKTFKRETDALLNAAKKLNCTNLTLITTDENQDIQVGDLTIHHRSAVDWLLGSFS